MKILAITFLLITSNSFAKNFKGLKKEKIQVVREKVKFYQDLEKCLLKTKSIKDLRKCRVNFQVRQRKLNMAGK